MNISFLPSPVWLETGKWSQAEDQKSHVQVQLAEAGWVVSHALQVNIFYTYFSHMKTASYLKAHKTLHLRKSSCLQN